MKDGKREQEFRTLQKMACLLEQQIGEAKELALCEGNCLLYRYREESVLAAAELSEKLTGRLRELAADCVTEPKLLLDYQGRQEKLHSIYVCYQNGILEVRIPVLLPHRKSNYVDFLDRPLAVSLRNWCSKQRERGEAVPAFARASLCFVHGYLEGGRVRDHDNVEAKHIQDVLALFFLQGDDGMHLDLYHTSEVTGQNRTILYLMEREKFPEWVLKRWG